MKVLVVSLDIEVHHYFEKNPSNNIISYYLEAASKEDEVNPEAAKFRSKQFVLMTMKKKSVVHDILKLGYDVLFSDIDVACLTHPFDYLLFENMDYAHSLNEPCSATNNDWHHFLDKADSEGNTGYYFMRSNPRSIKMIEDVLDAMIK
jgi:hypothetical protein